MCLQPPVTSVKKGPDSLAIPNALFLGYLAFTVTHPQQCVLSSVCWARGTEHGQTGARCRAASLSWTRADDAPVEDGVTTMTSLVLSAGGRRAQDRVTVWGGQFRLGDREVVFPLLPALQGLLPGPLSQLRPPGLVAVGRAAE